MLSPTVYRVFQSWRIYWHQDRPRKIVRIWKFLSLKLSNLKSQIETRFFLSLFCVVHFRATSFSRNVVSSNRRFAETSWRRMSIRRLANSTIRSNDFRQFFFDKTTIRWNDVSEKWCGLVHFLDNWISLWIFEYLSEFFDIFLPEFVFDLLDTLLTFWISFWFFKNVSEYHLANIIWILARNHFW